MGQLKLKWAYTYEKVPYARVGSQPAVSGGVLYVGAPNGKLLALDAKTGATRWTFDLDPITGPLPGGVQNQVRDGAAVYGDKVYIGDSTGRIYAVDKNTGRLVFATKVSEQPQSILTSSPLVVRGRLYVGVSTLESGAAGNPNYPCCSHRGSVVSLDANTGRVLWNYYTLPAAQQVGTWPSGAAKFSPSGGSVWSSPVADLATGTIFVGTGNNATGEAGDIDSVLALDMYTGRPRWKQQMTFPDTYTTQCEKPDPGEYCPGLGTTALDADFGASANVISVDGRTLVTIGQKNGMFYAFDARTGKVVWRTEIAPGPHGGAGTQWGSVYDGRYIYTATWFDGSPSSLLALDPRTGRIVWRSAHPADGCATGGAAAFPDVCGIGFTPAPSGTPGLLYEGSMDGKFRIFSARDGAKLWEFDAVRDFQGVNGVPGRGSAISGNGGAVIVDGMVYVQAGYYPFYPSDKGVVLLAFGL
ncbi:MAG: PQQ-binding-like beta-propeller repeat protein [Pseudonocardiaceae bacterium]|nr:PQQ-binding-like beta-propeller repeat protein [Pseudonocardiaceae bacterium]